MRLKEKKFSYLNVANKMVKSVEDIELDPFSTEIASVGFCSALRNGYITIVECIKVRDQVPFEMRGKFKRDGSFDPDATHFFDFESRAHRLTFLLFLAAQNNEI